MLTLALFLTVVIGLFAGSIRIFSLAITALVVKLYPVAMLLVIGVVAVWAWNKWR